MSICQSVRSVYLFCHKQNSIYFLVSKTTDALIERKKETSKQKVFKPETNTETETKAFKKKEIQNQKAERDNRC